jgi:hypothetical protein
MSIRSVKFVPALFAGVVAGGSLATTTDLRAQVLTTSAEAAVQTPLAAVDGCLSAPKGPTPAGSHWYYRLDRVTKRQCWYLRQEGDATDDKFARAAPPASAPTTTTSATEEPAPQQRSVARRSVSDARAEWVTQPRADVNPPARIERTAARAAPAPIVEPSNARPAMPNVLAPAPLSSVRWNEATATRASVDPADIRLAAATPPAARLTQAEEAQQPVVDQIAPAAAPDAAAAKPTASLQKLLVVMAAALALAGLIVSAIVRIGRLRARRAMRRKRRAMWDSAKTAKTRRRAPQAQPQAQPQPMFRNEDAVLRRAAAVPQPRTAPERPTRPPRERPQQERPYAPQERRHAPQDRMPQQRVSQDRAAPPDRDRERQVTEMLSRLARSAHS